MFREQKAESLPYYIMADKTLYSYNTILHSAAILADNISSEFEILEDCTITCIYAATDIITFAL